MQFVYENPEIEQALAAADTLNALEAPLKRVVKLVPELMAPENRGRKLFWPALDGLVPGLAAKLKLPDVPLAKSNDNVCIVATRFYATGGHGRVGEDIARLIGAERTTLIFTDLYYPRHYREFVFDPSNARHAHRSALTLGARSLVDRIIELYMMLAAIRPSRIFLMGNHMDVVAVTGCWPFRSVVEYVHHADYMPALGATLPFSAHADLTHNCHEACAAAGLKPVWASMTLPGGPRRPSGARRPGPLRIATCGAQNKYEHPAKHRWTDFVAAALKAQDAVLLHIGTVDQPGQGRIRAELAAAGVDPVRYRFLGPVADLRRALIDEQADAFLDSYPDGGGRANLEAMAVGIAPIVPIPPDLPKLLHFSSPLPCWAPIGAPEEVPAALSHSLELSDRIGDPDVQAAIAREFQAFERYVTQPS